MDPFTIVRAIVLETKHKGVLITQSNYVFCKLRLHALNADYGCT